MDIDFLNLSFLCPNLFFSSSLHCILEVLNLIFQLIYMLLLICIQPLCSPLIDYVFMSFFISGFSDCSQLDFPAHLYAVTHMYPTSLQPTY